MSKSERGQLRIIAGSWRGRKLSFPEREGLRPTTDRVRETVFNWLQMDLPGSRCLDLFAGSGALGFEAASRGAAKVVMVDSDNQTVNMLRDNIDLLSASQIKVVCGDVINFLQSCDFMFDVVFIDPPYRLDVIAQCCELLESKQCLSDHAKIYIECDASNDLSKDSNGLPDNWQCLKRNTAGQVGYHLFTREMDS
ncbi:MAG: 16S rRNA (guanine(966)-N(2))-methyltransferase RsmD [Gammaproteobacteria bacterium]|nr:16S rRNA (guanine(966)-N(2))-methyltransferase RsmD [Gammaproteobacteria bacterium]